VKTFPGDLQRPKLIGDGRVKGERAVPPPLCRRPKKERRIWEKEEGTSLEKMRPG